MRKWLYRLLLAVCLPMGGNLLLLWRLLDEALVRRHISAMFRWSLLTSAAFLLLLLALYLHVTPAWDRVKTGLRLRADAGFHPGVSGAFDLLGAP